jgi:hypothetical protein
MIATTISSSARVKPFLLVLFIVVGFSFFIRIAPVDSPVPDSGESHQNLFQAPPGRR